MMLGERARTPDSDTIELVDFSPTVDEKSAGRTAVKKEIRIDGGLVAWLQVVGAFCLFFTNW